VRLRTDAKVDLIRRVPLFEHCSKQELEQVASIADEIDLPEGKHLTDEGDRGREFLVLLEGTVDVKVGDRTINTLREGDFFGEIALISKRPRTATVLATSPVRALVIRDQEFRALLQRVPEIQLKVLEALADRVAKTDT
jgi:CRP/FNR family cyclic AMP-dependent transcriptional regulator